VLVYLFENTVGRILVENKNNKALFCLKMTITEFKNFNNKF